jgi:hypothetical protein
MPTNLPGLLTHRPGHQTRMPDLNRFLTANPSADPLVGNYVLVPAADMVVAGGLTSDAAGPVLGFTTTVSDGSIDIMDNTANQLAATPAMTLARAVPLAVDAAQRDQLLLLYVSDDNHLWLYRGDQTIQQNGDTALTIIPPPPAAADAVDLGLYDHGMVRAVTGPFFSLPAGDNSALLAVAWYANATDLMLSVVPFNADGSPSLPSPAWSVKLATQTAGSMFDLAAGDFDSDGDWEVAVAYEQADGAQVAVMLAVADITAGAPPTFSVSAPILVGHLAPVSITLDDQILDDGVVENISLAAGAFLATSTDEAVAVAWYNESYQPACVVASFAGGVPVIQGSPWVDSAWASVRGVSLAAGDLNLDGVDELALAQIGWNGGLPYVGLHVLTVGADYSVSAAASGLRQSPYNHVAIQVGLLATPGTAQQPAIFVLGGSCDYAAAILDVMAVPCTPGTFALATEWTVDNLSMDWAFNGPPGDLSLLLPDLGGNSVRVGPPQQFTFDQIGQILAIFNAPPAQAGVNFSQSGAVLTDTTTDVQDSHFTLNVHHTHTLSDEFSDNTGLSMLGLQINQSITNTYGENFSKTDDSGKVTTFSLMKTASVDDLLRVTYMPYTAWEYPVYAPPSSGASGTTVVGYLLLLWPDLTQFATIELAGSGPLIGYAPDHQLGNVLSYPASAPAAWNTANQVNQNLISLEIDTSVTTLTYDSTQTQSQTNTVQKDIGISINNSFSLSFNLQYLADLAEVALAATAAIGDAADDDGGGGDGGGGDDGGMEIGISFNSASHYTKSTTSTHQVGFTGSSAIVITYQPLTDAGQTYTVTPYIYFTADPAQIMVVDYSVTVPESIYWKGVFAQPNPTFNFEQTQAEDPLSQEYTRSLAFTPFVTEQGANAVRIAATVANYSFTAANGVLVEFFTQRPQPTDTGFQQATIEALTPGDRYTVSTDDNNQPIVWEGTPPASGQAIWARISVPGDSSIAPVVGFNLYPPSAWQGGG